MKISKKELTRELPVISQKNEYRVTWIGDWSSAELTRTVMTNNEIDVARYARERWGAKKVKTIELLREDIYAA